MAAVFLKRYFVEGLAHASYLVGDGGEAAVVDPKRDVDEYVGDAAAAGLRIVAVLNSHPHADFASGFRELASRTGAKIYTSHLAPVQYEREAACDGQRIPMGSLEIEILETPGHSPDSLSFLVRAQGQPALVFTGDLLFVNDVGRPDLRDAESDPSALAGALYDSLFAKILSLPDDVKVYPSHGAGSLCGRALGSAPFTTVRQEKQFNWAAQLKNRDQFVHEMLANLPDRPAYFSFDVGVNLRGAPALSSLPPLRQLSEAEVKHAAVAGATVIDTRHAALFGAGHFPGSLNIGLGSAMFTTWAGFFVPGDREIVLVVNDSAAAIVARLALSRIGFDCMAGFIEGDAFEEVHQLTQLSAGELKAAPEHGEMPFVLDVRTHGEWQAEHIEDARHVPLARLPGRVRDVPKDRRVAIICGSGYRSSIAASLLLRDGHVRLANVIGGMNAYSGSKFPEMHPADLVFGGEGI
jgi:hydroxyacylglutathione hydrolase